jgi:hypothetical protein
MDVHIAIDCAGLQVGTVASFIYTILDCTDDLGLCLANSGGTHDGQQ